MVVTRAPKSRFYGSSSALHYRVAAAVLQKNEGANHLKDVYERVGIKEGDMTHKFREMIEVRRAKKRELQLQPKTKRRRFELKANQKTQYQKSRAEGITYMSGMGPTMERAIRTTLNSGGWVPAQLPLHENCKVLLVDTETTGFGNTADLVQIAAQCDPNFRFNVYMLPEKPIHPEASAKTKLKIVNGKLFHFGKEVVTVSPREAAEGFIEFLKSLKSQIVFAGHNLIKFDIPVIFRWLENFDLVKDLCDLLYTDLLIRFLYSNKERRLNSNCWLKSFCLALSG